MVVKVTDCLQEKTKNILLSYWYKKIYSAASVAVSKFAEKEYEDFFTGVGGYGENESFEVNERSFFDLASLTKPFVTLPAILHLIDKKKIFWEEPLPSLLESTVPDPYQGVDLQSIMCHGAGFAAHKDYWQVLKTLPSEEKKKWLLRHILESPAEYRKGEKHVYSDLGYILLGMIVELKAGQNLDAYWQVVIRDPLGLKEQLFFPVAAEKEKKSSCIPTGRCGWSAEVLTGLVHDDNCRAMGGVGGHAGLFGSAAGVLAICKAFLNLYHGRDTRLPISRETFLKACEPVNDSEWTRGFNLVSPTGSSSGRYFSVNSIGHLGFTGVSFWIDLDKQQIVSLLSNRVMQGDDPAGIRKMRPELHDAVVRCLEQR